MHTNNSIAKVTFCLTKRNKYDKVGIWREREKKRSSVVLWEFSVGTLIRQYFSLCSIALLFAYQHFLTLLLTRFFLLCLPSSIVGFDSLSYLVNSHSNCFNFELFNFNLVKCMDFINEDLRRKMVRCVDELVQTNRFSLHQTSIHANTHIIWGSKFLQCSGENLIFHVFFHSFIHSFRDL